MSPPMAIAMGEACRVANEEMENDLSHVKMIYDRLYNKIISEVPFTKLNGHEENRYFGNLNVSFRDIFSAELLQEINSKIAFSAGAACLAEPSYVLQALKVNSSFALGSIRIGFGRFTTIQEADLLLDSLIPSVTKLRARGITSQSSQCKDKTLSEN